MICSPNPSALWSDSPSYSVGELKRLRTACLCLRDTVSVTLTFYLLPCPWQICSPVTTKWFEPQPLPVQYTALRADATSDMEGGMGGPTNSSFEEVIRHTFFNLKIYSYEVITCDTIIDSFCWGCSWPFLKHCGWGEYQCIMSLRDITEGLDCNSWAVFTLGSIDLPCWSTFTLEMSFGARACLPLSTVQYSRWQYALTHCCRKYPWTMESSLLQAITWPVF